GAQRRTGARDGGALGAAPVALSGDGRGAVDDQGTARRAAPRDSGGSRMIDVERPAEAPASLAGGTYSGTDVLEALHSTFQGKCYLCESPIELGTFQVDHRKPKGDERFDDLVCAWPNLFPTC